MNDKSSKKVILCILDGFGIAKPSKYNAITSANLPCFNRLVRHYPNTLLSASGLDVGIPLNQFGNSEVGHMTISAGRIIMQDLPKINSKIDDDSLKEVQVLQNIDKDQIIHILGICSDGGVHGHIDHIKYMIKIFSAKKNKIFLHLVLDGRDTAPFVAKKYISHFVNCSPQVKIGSIAGRYYAMDRDNRLDRTKKMGDAILYADSKKCSDFLEYIQDSYSQNLSEEFIEPAVSDEYHGVGKNDVLIITNYRADRIRQIAHYLSESKKFKNLISMNSYSKDLDRIYIPLIEKTLHRNSLGEVIANHGYKQIRIAETEKYAHVTFFFNLGSEEIFKNEDRKLVPSPKVANYIDAPSMSSNEITDEVIAAIESEKYDFILVNYAAPDMIGHTGNMGATVRAIECIDKCLSRVVEQAEKYNITLIITADHGNCESMFDEKTNNIVTAHTGNPVPFILVNADYFDAKLEAGRGLRDVAPTILDIMNIDKPAEMSGSTLIVRKD